MSEALIFASTNPQYEDRLFIEFQVQYMKIPSSNLGRTCCVQKLFLTIFVHNMFSPCFEKRRAFDKDLPVSSSTNINFYFCPNCNSLYIPNPIVFFTLSMNSMLIFFIENKLRMPYCKVHCIIFCQCHGVLATTYLFGKLGSSERPNGKHFLPYNLQKINDLENCFMPQNDYQIFHLNLKNRYPYFRSIIYRAVKFIYSEKATIYTVIDFTIAGLTKIFDSISGWF